MESQNSESVEIFRLGDEKNPLIISVVSFNGSRNLDIRRYYYDKNAKTIKPSTKGIFLKEEEFFHVFESLSQNFDNIKTFFTDELNQREISVRTVRKEKITATKISNESIAATTRFSAWPGPNFFMSNLESNKNYINFNTRNKVIKRIMDNEMSGLEVLEKVVSAFVSASSNINFTNKTKPDAILEYLELEWSNHLR
jgi:hypothetical protein